MKRFWVKRVAWLGAISGGLLFLGGCAVGYGEGYYGEAALPASYYYGPDFYDPGYPYYYHFHDNDWWRHHDHDAHWGDRGHWYGGGREAWAGRHEAGREGGARTAGHMEGPGRGRDGGDHIEGGHDGGFHGAATAGGHIGGGTRR